MTRTRRGHRSLMVLVTLREMMAPASSLAVAQATGVELLCTEAVNALETLRAMGMVEVVRDSRPMLWGVTEAGAYWPEGLWMPDRKVVPMLAAIARHADGLDVRAVAATLGRRSIETVRNSLEKATDRGYLVRGGTGLVRYKLAPDLRRWGEVVAGERRTAASPCTDTFTTGVAA